MFRTAIVLFAMSWLVSSSVLADDKIRLSYNSDWPPYSYGVGMAVTGILPDLMREIVENRMGLKVVQNGAPWKRAQILVERGGMDALVTVPTAKRLKFSKSSENVVYTLEMRAVVRRDGSAFNRLSASPDSETLRGLRICDISGNGWAERFFGNADIKYQTASKARACLRMIQGGRVDVMIQPAAVATSEIADAGLGEDLVVLGNVYGKMDFTLLLSNEARSDPTFLKKFDETVRAMKEDGSFDSLIDRLRGVGSD